jgi:DNA topoisomerase-1
MNYAVIEKNEKHVDAIAGPQPRPTHSTSPPTWIAKARRSRHIPRILRERNLLDGKALHRVVFSEITPHAIQEAVANPRDLSLDLVNAQQARRALDYLVGFNLSPVLWRKVQRGLSAGRVQSPALRMIVEREEEIEAFKAQEYWSIEADCAHPDMRFSARLTRLRGKKFEQFGLTNERDAHAARTFLLKVRAGPPGRQRSTVEGTQAPAIAAVHDLDAAAGSRAQLGFTTSRTMRLAQGLYEGVSIGTEGTVGLITYMRTESVNLGNDAIAEIRKVIARDFGAKALPESPNLYRAKSKNAQEAHEAIRPTSALHTPASMAPFLNDDQRKLYDLIWKRAIASQMQYATLNTVSVDFDAGGDSTFRASGTTIVDPGFLAVYEEGHDVKTAEDEEAGRSCRPCRSAKRAARRHPRRTALHRTAAALFEASLVKTLEEYGIGRPSTYASIIQTLLNREYVTLESRRFRPTDVGRRRTESFCPRISASTSTTTSPPSSRTNSTRSAAAKKTGCR